MCLTCGCHNPYQKHHPAAIDYADLSAAANDASISPGIAAKNIVETVALVDDAMKGEGVATAMVKSEPEQRYTLGLAYGANLPDVGKAADGFRDFVGEPALRDAAWSYMRKGARVGLHHQDGTDGHGTVVESYLWPADDWTAPNGFTVRKGDWLLGVVWDEPTWELIKSGQINGYSPQGSARRRQPAPESLAQLRR